MSMVRLLSGLSRHETPAFYASRRQCCFDLGLSFDDSHLAADLQDSSQVLCSSLGDTSDSTFGLHGLTSHPGGNGTVMQLA